MTDLEIPYVKNRGRRYRAFEILPGALSWSILIFPFVLSQISPHATVFFIIIYLLLWFVKAIGLNIRALQGYKMLKLHQKLPWDKLLAELQSGKVSQPDRHIPSWHYETVRRLQETPAVVQPDDIIHAIIVATYNEAREIVEPTFQSVLESKYDMKKVILVLAYEERGGPAVEAQSEELIAQYKGTFMHAMTVKHPKDIPGEVIGKGGNITYAGRELAKYLETKKIDPMHVVVTTLDADNKPHPEYLSALSYLYAASPDPLHVSYQPIPMYTNNIWDVPAPMRVIATGNTFWNVVLSLRPHMMRNFASHAQSMAALIDTDYWSVRTIVEDGHQFWRTYFRYDGKHEVYPIYLPIYQDAVLSNTFIKTLRAQFIQLRRWAWGASDIAYVIETGFFRNNKVPKLDLTFKTLRLIEGHVSWATAPLILAFSAFIPLLFNPQDYAANQLPVIASSIQRVALVGIFVTLFLSLKLLPPKPARYKHHRTVFMVLQWVLLPVTTILYNSLSAVNSQTRLMFGRYLGKFDITEKAFVTEDNKKKS
jgi:cellulose synthase/poly-beta-1,6-N-acetylglucosamine synthase-like glycosyltransferase